MKKSSRPSYLYWFFIPYALFALTLLVIILLTNKGDLHLAMNDYHTPFLDFFFKHYTELGASIPFIIAVGLLLYRCADTLYLLITLGINSLVTNSLKLLFREPRPTLYFQNLSSEESLTLVDGVSLYTHNGFPSGHTSAAFVLMICLTLIIKRKDFSLIAFIMAALVGYSRVYLSQHFTEDILFGSIVGITVGLLCYGLHQRMMTRTNWGAKSLPAFIKRKS